MKLSEAQFFSYFFVGCFESSRQICRLLPKQLTNLSAASKSLCSFEFGKSFLVPERRQICRLLSKQPTKKND
jgi:hypothetical protein